ncbi:redoxin domain-containing protein [Pseudoroseomonas globiformis]|uniref:Redoxin domain-containing protein n=1 Tax=Teichococcus globiformis TaxID=2307229 RepID=A0ABV7FZ93_9PROT
MMKTPAILPHAGRRELILGAAGLAGAGLLLRGTPAAAAPRIGQAAPDFSRPDSHGGTRSLSALRGKLVVLEWTNHDCPFVMKHYGASNMQNLQREVADAGGVWLSVISSAPGEQGHVPAAQANELTRSREAAPTAVLLDPEGEMGRAYNAQTTPHMYIISAEGTLLYMGGIDSIASTRVEDLQKATPHFRNAFQAVREGRPVQNAVTRPYGCNVKYAA